MIKIGIVGGAGYTAGELLRLLFNHPQVEIVFVQSSSQKGQPITAVHKDLLGETDLHFTNGALPQVDVLFMCLGHERSAAFLKDRTFSESTRIIDLSQDFRHQEAGNPFIYGLPELNRDQIKKSRFLANPGCFATAIQLALLPLASVNGIREEVQVHAITGSTGAGVNPQATTHFSWRQNNLSIYKPFQHQHLKEIRQNLESAGNNPLPEINFIPVRGNFTKGIFCTVYTRVNGTVAKLAALYNDYYQDHPFTLTTTQPVSLKEVINTNKCFLHLQYQQGKLLITSILDNLIKGASGQAVQNMNLMCGLEERTGLNLKATGF